MRQKASVPPGAGVEVAVGDRIMFKRTQITEITNGENRYVVVPFKGIIGK
ncbi:MAG TPA: hypothetical protein VKA68_10565 [bacterium]|nr:hypothetical protein [bacterium]